MQGSNLRPLPCEGKGHSHVSWRFRGRRTDFARERGEGRNRASEISICETSRRCSAIIRLACIIVIEMGVRKWHKCRHKFLLLFYGKFIALQQPLILSAEGGELGERRFRAHVPKVGPALIISRNNEGVAQECFNRAHFFLIDRVARTTKQEMQAKPRAESSIQRRILG